MRKATFRHGTAKNDAETAPGYVASGESAYSRRAANPEERVRINDRYVNRTKGSHSKARLIAESKSLLAKMRCDLLIITDKKRLAKLRDNIAIKTAFIERLENEQRDEVTTIPGEYDIEPWGNVK